MDMNEYLLMAVSVCSISIINCCEQKLTHRITTSSKTEITELQRDELTRTAIARKKIQKKYLEEIDAQKLRARLDREDGSSFTTYDPNPCLITLKKEMDHVTPLHLQAQFDERLLRIAPPHLRELLQSSRFRSSGSYFFHSNCNNRESCQDYCCGATVSLIFGCLPLSKYASESTHREVLSFLYNNIPATTCTCCAAGLGIVGCLYCCFRSNQSMKEGKLEETACRSCYLNDLPSKPPKMIIE